MTRLALVLTGIAATLAAAPRASTPVKAPATTVLVSPAKAEVTRQTAEAWVRNFGKLNIQEGRLATFTRPDGC